MTRTARINERPSPEEMEQVFQGLRAWGPEGERIVEVHKEIIQLLDEMIEKHRRSRQGLSTNNR